MPLLIEAVGDHDADAAHDIMARTYANAGAIVRGLLAPTTGATAS